MGDAHYLPQSPLPEVPGGRGAAMARRPRGRAAAGSLLPRRLHPAGGDRRHRASRTRAPSTTSCSGAAAETLTTIAADPKHLGARIGLTAVLHTWGSALTHHPHVHVIVPGGGLSPDGSRWIACKRGFFLPVRVLSRLFRRLFLEGLAALHAAGRLVFLGDLARLADKAAFDAVLAPLRRTECRVGGDVAIPTPHRPGRAGFPHPVLHGRVSLAAAYPWRIRTGGSGCRASSSLKRDHGTTP